MTCFFYFDCIYRKCVSKREYLGDQKIKRYRNSRFNIRMGNSSKVFGWKKTERMGRLYQLFISERVMVLECEAKKYEFERKQLRIVKVFGCIHSTVINELRRNEIKVERANLYKVRFKANNEHEIRNKNSFYVLLFISYLSQAYVVTIHFYPTIALASCAIQLAYRRILDRRKYSIQGYRVEVTVAATFFYTDHCFRLQSWCHLL